MRWEQIGVLDTLKDFQIPFFIEWLTSDHPSKDGKSISSISKIEISGSETSVREWFDFDLTSSLIDIEIEWIQSVTPGGETGLHAVHFETPFGVIRIE